MFGDITYLGQLGSEGGERGECCNSSTLRLRPPPGTSSPPGWIGRARHAPLPPVAALIINRTYNSLI